MEVSGHEIEYALLGVNAMIDMMSVMRMVQQLYEINSVSSSAASDVYNGQGHLQPRHIGYPDGQVEC